MNKLIFVYTLIIFIIANFQIKKKNYFKFKNFFFEFNQKKIKIIFDHKKNKIKKIIKKNKIL